MTQYAYARQIPGGFQIVSLAREPYESVELPKQCQYTGLRVLLLPEVAERLIRIIGKGRQKLGLLFAGISDAINKFVREGVETERLLRENPENETYRENDLAQLLAGASVGSNAHKTFQQWEDVSEQWLDFFCKETEDWNMDTARKLGHDVTPKVRVPSGIEQFLQAMFASGTEVRVFSIDELPNCGRESCKVHGPQIRAEREAGGQVFEDTNPNVSSNTQATPEKETCKV